MEDWRRVVARHYFGKPVRGLREGPSGRSRADVKPGASTRGGGQGNLFREAPRGAGVRRVVALLPLIHVKQRQPPQRSLRPERPLMRQRGWRGVPPRMNRTKVHRASLGSWMAGKTPPIAAVPAGHAFPASCGDGFSPSRLEQGGERRVAHVEELGVPWRRYRSQRGRGSSARDGRARRRSRGPGQYGGR